MLRSQIQSATALSEAGRAKSIDRNGLLARKRLREGSGSPTGPRKKPGLRHTTSYGLQSGLDNALQQLFTPSAGQSPRNVEYSSSISNRGSILSPPYQPYDAPPANRESNCLAPTTAPAPDRVNAGATLGTPPREETSLHECYQTMIPYKTGHLPIVDRPLSSATPLLAPPGWPTTLDQLQYPSRSNEYSQQQDVEAASAYAADLISLGHSTAPPTTIYGSGMTSDTLNGYQNFPVTPLSEHHIQLCASQTTYYDVVGQSGFEATPDVAIASFNIGLPLYQSPVFTDQTPASFVQTYQGQVFEQELPFPLVEDGYTEGTTEQLVKGLASSDEEALMFKTSQSPPESKAFLDEIPLKKERRTPPQEIKQPSDLSPEPVHPIQGFYAPAQGNADKESSKSPQKRRQVIPKLDPTTEMQLVYQCFNSPGRSFASDPQSLDKWGPPTKSVISTQGQRARKPLDEDARQETSRTRDVGACVRCKIQRVRCKPNEDEPDGPCLACIKVARNRSQKRIHVIGCHRYKLQEISLFRTTRLRYTKRWQGAQIRDVPTYGDPVTIWIYQGLATPLAIQVRRYHFDKQDDRHIVARKWADPHGTCREQSDYPYALASVNETKDGYRDYITNHKFEAYNRILTAKPPESRKQEVDDIIKHVYRLAQKNHYVHLPVGARWNFYRPPEKWDFRQISEESFMAGIFEMWFAMRQSAGSSHVHFGDEELEPADGDVRPGSSWRALTPLGTPKMIVGQFNSINITCVLRPLAKVLLKVLMSWIADRHYHRWMSIFYATFIILREIAHTTLDAYRHAERNPDRDFNAPLKPNWSENIVELHESANIILAHWHYFNCSTDPNKLHNDKARAKSPLKELNDEQLEIVRVIWSKVASWKASVSLPSPSPSSSTLDGPRKQPYAAWCEPLYFAAQMFDVDWKPLPVFQG